MMLNTPPALSGLLCHAWPGRAGAFQTVAKMRELVQHGQTVPFIVQSARNIVNFAPQHDFESEVLALFDFVQKSVRYVRDVLGVETLATPETTLRHLVGDCDDKSTLLAALLQAVGVPTRFVLAGYHGADFEHVYLQAFVGADWVSLDATTPEPAGFEAPGATVYWIEGGL